MVPRHIFILLILTLTSAGCSRTSNQQHADIATDQWRYDIRCASEARQGTYYVTIGSIVRKTDLAITQSQKNAVHAVLFKGYPNNKENGCKGQKPLIRNINVYENNKEFFDDFFNLNEKTSGYDYMRFVQGSGTVTKSVKINRKEYKMEVEVVVSKDELRKYLEQSKIIRSLGLD